ncbi:MAG TPA: AMP-binding protein [Mycobacterium sp.]|nr:AMP-binding protein [Mycobacterium sp.]
MLSYGEADRLSDALAVGLIDKGFGHGERVALYLQNVPQYVLGLLAIWKAGGIAVAINPMLTAREVEKLITDSTPTVLLALDELYTVELREVLEKSSVRRLITTSALDWQRDDDARVLPAARFSVPSGAEDLRALIEEYDSRSPEAMTPSNDDIAVITYTSGTTGASRGAMNTHRNVETGGLAYRDWFELGADDVVLGVAPLFHVTGLTGHVACSIAAGASLLLSYRFQIDVVLDAIHRHRPTFTVGAITVFIALGESTKAERHHLESLTKIASGGAPVAAATADRFQQRFGAYVHNVYGMTETTSPVLAVPVGTKAPVETETQALSVGVPMGSACVAVLDDDGKPLPPGELGEIAVAGPQIVPGYWRNDAATQAAMRDGWLLTGDVGYVDADGWYYLVDRKKDMIVASGYKVWPREVEDVLYTYEAVLEAAVVGVPDPYRGETVKAYVSLRSGYSTTPEELIEYCRGRLAAYKSPRQIEVVETIPKTATGKVLRRQLRDKDGRTSNVTS